MSIDLRRRNIVMHCSGPNMVALLRSEVADRVVTSSTGTEFTFGA